MKKLSHAKVLLVLLLLSSMAWSADKEHEIAVMQSCCGYILPGIGLFEKRSDYSDFFTDGTAPDNTTYVFGTDSSNILLYAFADDNYELAGWTIVSGASNCSFVYESLSVVILKAQGKCAIKANRVSSLLTLEAGIGGVVHSSVPTTSSISTLGLRISAKPVTGYSNSRHIYATPSAGYRFDKWTITSGSSNCSIFNSTSTSTNVELNGACTIKANFVKRATLTIGTATGGTTSPTGSSTVDAGKKVQIKAIPDATHVFTSWSKATNCPVQDTRAATTYVTVNGDCTIKPAFVKFYELRITAGTGGTTTETTKRTYASGSAEVSVTATPNSGYRFDKWVKVSGGDACYVLDETSATTDVYVRETCKIQATFKKLRPLTVTASEGGSVSPTSVVVDEGDEYAITATPDASHRFHSWNYVVGGGACYMHSPGASTMLVTVSDDCTINAFFLRIYEVKLTAGTGGSTSFTAKTVDPGSMVDISASVTQSGYRFDKWTSSSTKCVITDATAASTSAKISADCSITANFVKTQQVTVSAGTGGSVSSAGTKTVDYGSVNTITATPSSGYRFDKWTSSSTKCVITDATAASTSAKISDDCSITANFVKTYSLDVYTVSHNGPAFYKSLVVDEGSTNQLVVNPIVSNYDFDEWVFLDNNTLDEISVPESVCKVENADSPTAAKVVVNGSCTVAAKLRIRVNVSVLAEEGGTVTPSGELQGHVKEYIDISARANEGYRFLYWVNSANCKIEDRYSADTRFLSESTVGCTVTAKFRKQGRIVIDSVENIDIAPRDEYVDVGKTINVYPYRSAYDWQFSHFEYISGEQNCPVTMNSTGVIITVNGDCEMRPVVVPYFELTGDFKTYYHYYNGEYSSADVRFHAATEDSTWYYVEMASSVDHSGVFENYGDNMWTQNPVSTCTGNMDGLGCYFKSVNTDNYVTVSTTTWVGNPFSVRYSKVPTDYVDVEFDLAGKLIQRPTIDVGQGMDTLIAAEELTGYVFKEWKLMDGDCELDSPGNNDARVSFRSSRCRYRAVYEADPAANVGVGLVNFSYSGMVQCNYVSVADSTKSQTFFAVHPKQISYVDVSDITITYDGDTLQLYTVGDTIWMPIVNESLRDYYGTDSIPVVVEEGNEPYYKGITVCMVLSDGILNGDEHTIAVYTDYAGKTLSWEYSEPEPVYHDPDAPDIIKLSDMGAGSGSIVRTTEKMEIEVQTQDFSDDNWFYDYYWIDFPATMASTLPVKVSCLSSDDEETLDLAHVGGGVYRLSDLVKSEGKAVKGDSVLTCATSDMIVTEFVDPFYKTVTRDTTPFGDIVPLEYVFLEEDLVRDIDSVETTEVDFAFSLNMVSPTYDKVDTIVVALFTDLGDTLWVPAFETDVYSGVFEGHGSFRFVTSPEDQKDDVLDAAMDLDADVNRAVIRMQIGNDKSALDTRDSIVVFYEFIPAVSADIQDLDLDGRADYVRVHFARSILQEQLKIDTLFWGGAEDEGRGVADRDMEISNEGDWIYVTLESPFEYGVSAVDSTGKKFVSVSRNTSSAIQKVYLSDKMGPVPVRAKKLPGAIGDEEYLNGNVTIPPDTLVVTLSEPVELSGGAKAFGKKRSAWSDMFQFAESCDNGKVHRVSLEEEPELDESGTVWTLVLPHEVDIRVGYCIMTNPEAPFQDMAGNAPAIGGITVEGDDGEIYLYSIKADPAVALDTVSAIRVETRMDYKAEVAIFDNIGIAVAQFDLENDEGFGRIEWDQRTFADRRVGTGVYIWKIRFVFADGHRETRFIRTGIRRR